MGARARADRSIWFAGGASLFPLKNSARVTSPISIAQRRLVKLAGGETRKLGLEIDGARTLDVGEMSATKGDELRLGFRAVQFTIKEMSRSRMPSRRNTSGHAGPIVPDATPGGPPRWCRPVARWR